MKAILITAAVVALAATFSAPALAQQAGENAAAKQGGQCAVSQAILAAIDDNKQQHMQATKLKIDLLIERALASSRAAKLGGSPVKLGKGSSES